MKLVKIRTNTGYVGIVPWLFGVKDLTEHERAIYMDLSKEDAELFNLKTRKDKFDAVINYLEKNKIEYFVEKYKTPLKIRIYRRISWIKRRLKNLMKIRVYDVAVIYATEKHQLKPEISTWIRNHRKVKIENISMATDRSYNYYATILYSEKKPKSYIM